MRTQWGLEVASWAVFAGIVARAGEAHLAAHTIVVRIYSMSFLPGHAIGEAASILTGQAVGAQAPTATRRAVRSAGTVAFLLMGGMGLLFVFMGDWLVGMFRSDAEVIAIGGDVLMLAALFQIADSVALTRSGGLAVIIAPMRSGV
jgi:MATE family multidrug resistance protein